MFAALPWAWVGLLCLAQASLPAAPPESEAALRAWEDGQRAMTAGRTDQAIACYERSLRLDPALARNHLSLAAAFLSRAQDERAAPHLALYVEAQPDHLVIRAHYAELLLRLERRDEARVQFERFVADVQDHETLARQHLVHCHSRLMEIAEGAEDEYAEHLHRGIGLYLLGCQRARLGEAEEMPSAEGLLCKAAGELTVARLRRPEEARPWWYLYAVWTELAQQQPASRCLRAAAAAAPLSYLTPAEQRDLYLACRRAGREVRHKAP
jgi:tetratricopeptide (TPR) repeat protein